MNTTMSLVPVPPAVPSPHWLRAFAERLSALKPGLGAATAMQCAVAAHQRSWLLEPAEAAFLWLSATDAPACEVRRLPRDLLG
jgi:hypothetical protein